MKRKFVYWMGFIAGVLSLPRLGFSPPLEGNQKRTLGFNFDAAAGLSGRLVSPNGDGANDAVLFTFNNPFDSAVTLRILDLTGSEIVSEASAPGQTQFQWDGRGPGGEPLRSGIYIYQIESEGAVFSGAIVVAR